MPLGTETLTSQVTVRIGSGKTVLASGLEKRADAESTGQLVLASARLLDTSSDAKALAPEGRMEERQIRVFSLQSTAAEDAAAVIKKLCDDGSGQIKVGVDSRTNSLIVSGEKERHLDVVEAVLLTNCVPSLEKQVFSMVVAGRNADSGRFVRASATKNSDSGAAFSPGRDTQAAQRFPSGLNAVKPSIPGGYRCVSQDRSTCRRGSAQSGR